MQGLRSKNSYLPVMIAADGQDLNFTPRDAALNASRIPFMQVLGLAMERRGGLRRIKQLSEQRNRQREKAFAKMLPGFTEELDRIKAFLFKMRTDFFALLKAKSTQSNTFLKRKLHRSIFPRMQSARRQEINLRKDLEAKPRANLQSFRGLMVILRAAIRRLRTVSRRAGIMPLY
jgi:hypothetical protein